MEALKLLLMCTMFLIARLEHHRALAVNLSSLTRAAATTRPAGQPSSYQQYSWNSDTLFVAATMRSCQAPPGMSLPKGTTVADAIRALQHSTMARQPLAQATAVLDVSCSYSLNHRQAGSLAEQIEGKSRIGASQRQQSALMPQQLKVSGLDLLACAMCNAQKQAVGQQDTLQPITASVWRQHHGQAPALLTANTSSQQEQYYGFLLQRAMAPAAQADDWQVVEYVPLPEGDPAAGLAAHLKSVNRKYITCQRRTGGLNAADSITRPAVGPLSTAGFQGVQRRILQVSNGTEATNQQSPAPTEQQPGAFGQPPVPGSASIPDQVVLAIGSNSNDATTSNSSRDGASSSGSGGSSSTNNTDSGSSSGSAVNSTSSMLLDQQADALSSIDATASQSAGQGTINSAQPNSTVQTAANGPQPTNTSSSDGSNPASLQGNASTASIRSGNTTLSDPPVVMLDETGSTFMGAGDVRGSLAATRLLCALQAEVGNCRASIPRWAYDTESRKCKTFTWGGCGGNGNNFITRELCEATCSAAMAGGKTPSTSSNSTNSTGDIGTVNTVFGDDVKPSSNGPVGAVVLPDRVLVDRSGTNPPPAQLSNSASLQGSCRSRAWYIVIPTMLLLLVLQR